MMHVPFKGRIHPTTVQIVFKMPSKKAEQGTATLSKASTKLTSARVHIRFTRRQWGHVLFSDESRIQVSRADGRKRV